MTYDDAPHADRGQISEPFHTSDFPITTRARQVIGLARGLTMHAQLGAPRKTLLKDAEEAAELVLLPRRENATPER